MIGVLSRPEQRGVVEEFFQLFKTPWEFYCEGRDYDVVLATSGNPPTGPGPKVVLIYGAERREDDPPAAPVVSRSGHVALDYRGTPAAAYGNVLSFDPAGGADPCGLTADSRPAGFRRKSGDQMVFRIGYDLFEETAFLLTAGQPVDCAAIPALEIHIRMLRDWITESGVPVLEIPPSPAGCEFAVCLTHDIDFIGIRRHKFDHTLLGFLYRSTVGALTDLAKGRIPLGRVWDRWKAVARLPLIYLGWSEDYWLPFPWYLRAEEGLGATYFLIPFKHRAGERVRVPHAARRASSYDVEDLEEWIPKLREAGCEVGVHGIDAWHDSGRGKAELERVNRRAGGARTGIRMHWLMRDEKTFSALEEAGYAYDSTVGYNETAGYRSGTLQAYRPFGTLRFLELPMHIQDGALFYSGRLGLSEGEAWTICMKLVEDARRYGGALTVLWHDRSPGPERFWGGFYLRLLEKLKSLPVWFGTAGRVVEWFGRRREVSFTAANGTGAGARVALCSPGGKIDPPLTVRWHCARQPGSEGRTVDLRWTGEESLEVSAPR